MEGRHDERSHQPDLEALPRFAFASGSTFGILGLRLSASSTFPGVFGWLSKSSRRKKWLCITLNFTLTLPEMFKQFGLPHWLLLYCILVPVAIFIGYLLATPTDFTSYALLSMLLFLLSFPLIVRWHYPFMLFAWNAWIIVFFVPGQPSLGVVMAAFSFCFAMLDRAMNKQTRFLHVRALAYPLIALAIVVAVTAKFTGGISGRALGAETWGAKRYLGVFGAILGYFAITARRIPAEKAFFYISLFVLGGVTAMVSDIVYAAGPSLYFLFVLFPATAASLQATTQDTMMRLNGLAFAALAGFEYVVMRFGIRGVLEWTKPWRLLSLLALMVVSLLGGYRSLVLILFFILVFQFAFEGLLRSRLFPFVLLFSLLAITFVIAFIQDMPLSVQRSLSFLPLEVDSMASQDAAGTAEWRLQMWRAVLPDVPRYLLLGKGFAFNGTDYMLTQEAMRQGYYNSYEDTLISGNYHHGILTLIIPFGIFGFLSFLWFCVAALGALYRNYRYGEEPLRLINTFLLAYFCARLVFYITLYGQFDLDLVLFTGTVGLSVALNGGVKTRETQESEEIVEVEEAVPA